MESQVRKDSSWEQREPDSWGSTRPRVHSQDSEAASPVGAGSAGNKGAASDLNQWLLWHKSLEESLYRQLWGGDPGECHGWGDAWEGDLLGERDRSFGERDRSFGEPDRDEWSQILRDCAVEYGVEMEEEALTCIASSARLLGYGACACKARQLMDAVLRLLSSRQAIAARAGGRSMRSEDAFSLMPVPLEPVTLEPVVRELAILGCAEVLFSPLQYAYLRLLNRCGDPVPLTWMAEQLQRSPEYLSQHVEPLLLELGLVTITVQGRFALVELPLHQVCPPVSDTWPTGAAMPEVGPSGMASARLSLSRRSGSGLRFGACRRSRRSTPNSGRTGWIVVEQHWGRARPG